MKRISLSLVALFTCQLALLAQVTRISNNTNLSVGFPINASKAIFVQGETNKIWVTDGTLANTNELAYPVTIETMDALALWNGKLLFSGLGPNGAELYVTDGTPAGTSMIKDIYAGPTGSHPRSMVLVNDQVYFFAETPDAGVELWKTNGTAAGTVRIKDINPGPAASYSENGLAYVHNGIMYFSAVTDKGLELWRSNGTEAGTYLLKDIFAGPNSSTPKFFQAYNNELFFAATDADGGRELWKTSGTEAGTVRVKDIYPSTGSSNIEDVLLFKNKLFFAARSSVQDTELWMSDGTDGGTVRVKDINPGTSGSNPDIANAIVINNKILFAAEALTTGRELYYTDGTELGTGLFKDLLTGPQSSSPVIMIDHHFNFLTPGPNASNYALYNGKIFFYTGSIFTSVQLWITDGTPGNTTMLKDFGPVGLIQGSYIYTQSGLFFPAHDAAKGYEVFNSQGTAASTKLFADVNPDDDSFPFFQFFFLNGKVFFTADDGDSPEGDRDLFVIEASEIVLPLQLLKFGAAGIAAGVQLDWQTQNEKNTHHFEIERSIDGSRFEKIAELTANNNSSNATYNWLDASAYQQKSARLYYRLKMLDRDGKFSYSPVALVHLDQQLTAPTIYPNPAKNYLGLSFSADKTQEAQLGIRNGSGQLVKTLAIKIWQGTNQQQVPLGNLAPGIYFVEVKVAGQAVLTQRFLKQ